MPVTYEGTNWKIKVWRDQIEASYRDGRKDAWLVKGGMYLQDGKKWVIDGFPSNLPMGLMLQAINNMCEYRIDEGSQAYIFESAFRVLERLSAQIIDVHTLDTDIIVTFTTFANRPPWREVKGWKQLYHDDGLGRETDADVEGSGRAEPAPEPADTGTDSTHGQVAGRRRELPAGAVVQSEDVPAPSGPDDLPL